MFLKYIINDNGLHNLHKEGYEKKGRWLLAVATLIGWGVSIFIELPEVVPVFLQAFLAVGVLLNVLKEELPKAKKSNYWAFVIGGFSHAALLIFLSTLEVG